MFLGAQIHLQMDPVYIYVQEPSATFLEKVLAEGPLLKFPNMCMAGGFPSILMDPKLDIASFPGSDIDYFIFGKPKEAKATLIAALTALREAIGKNMRITVNRSVVTVTSSRRTMQFVILKDTVDVAGVLSRFDMDHVRVAFDGEKVFVASTAMRAFASRATVMNNNTDARSLSHRHVRAYKACLRGYKIACGGKQMDIGAVLRCVTVQEHIAKEYLAHLGRLSKNVFPELSDSALLGLLETVHFSGLGGVAGYGGLAGYSGVAGYGTAGSAKRPLKRPACPASTASLMVDLAKLGLSDSYFNKK